MSDGSATKDSDRSSALSAGGARQLVDPRLETIEGVVLWIRARRGVPPGVSGVNWQLIADDFEYLIGELKSARSQLAALLDPAPQETNEEELESRRDRTGEPVVPSPPQRPMGD